MAKDICTHTDREDSSCLKCLCNCSECERQYTKEVANAAGWSNICKNCGLPEIITTTPSKSMIPCVNCIKRYDDYFIKAHICPRCHNDELDSLTCSSCRCLCILRTHASCSSCSCICNECINIKIEARRLRIDHSQLEK